MLDLISTGCKTGGEKPDMGICLNDGAMNKSKIDDGENIAAALQYSNIKNPTDQQQGARMTCWYTCIEWTAHRHRKRRQNKESFMSRGRDVPWDSTLEVPPSSEMSSERMKADSCYQLLAEIRVCGCDECQEEDST